MAGSFLESVVKMMKRGSVNTTKQETIFRTMDPRWQHRLAAGCWSEAAGAVGAVILSIIGLAGIASVKLAAIAMISLGIGMLLESASLASCLKYPLQDGSRRGEWLELMGAAVGKLAGGIGGIVVGVLVILGITAASLLPVGVLIFGAAFLFTSMVSVVSELQEIAGAVAFVLGVVAISGLHPLTLVLVALLGLGVIAIVNGAASERRMAAAGYNP